MSCQTESSQYSNYKFAVFPENRTEQMLMNRIRGITILVGQVQ